MSSSLTTSGYFVIILFMRSYSKKIFIISSIIFLAGISFVSGFFVGTEKNENIIIAESTANLSSLDNENVDMSLFWDVWNTIDIKYVSKDDIDTKKKLYGAIEGLVSSLDDPYTAFFPPKEAKDFESEVRGNFEGVGMEIGLRDDILTVVAPLKNTPAEKAGILAGDKIIKIDNITTFGLRVDEAVDMIRGERGTAVLLTIIRKGILEPFEINIIRDTIDIPTLSTKKRDDGVFVIEIYNFSGHVTGLFKDALREFIESGYDKLIIDLRNNPGGFLEASIDMASWFIEAGKPVVREMPRDGKEVVYRSKGYNIFNENLKLAILINQGSASASEIFAGALSEYGKAILVGKKSFGKGSVQELIQLSQGTSLKVTIAKWLTPNGVSISKDGLNPTFEVDITKEDIEEKRDPQLQKAIELLKNK